MEQENNNNKNEEKGISQVVNKLEAKVLEGNYYEAQQLYKTLYFRHSNGKRWKQVRELLTSGATIMLSRGHINEGSDLALLLIQSFSSSHTNPSAEIIDSLIQLFSLYSYSSLSSSTNFTLLKCPDGSSCREESKDEREAKNKFIQAVLKWNSVEGNSNDISRLHFAFAMDSFHFKHYSKSQKHFLRSNNPHEFSKMLIEWSSEGYPSERDLFLARSVLQYLSLGNLKDANALYTQFLMILPEDSCPRTPLIHFIRFLLLTVERDAYSLFQKIKESYKPSLLRDPSFLNYLDQIALVFFKVEPPKPQANNLFSGLFRSLMTPPSLASRAPLRIEKPEDQGVD
eukprot:TRINITY_DN5350_c0_g1_i4.p1 TRINITY_DN5350_c0_g1~~TRINITY_DN5350_c0_g1_i4.p1  ORF type:complete len:342 (+),score=81.49 TRINITY_DN5350_c0_g1_i4:91-1116(+)